MRRAILLLAALALLLTACDGGTEESDGTQTPTPIGSATGSASPSASGLAQSDLAGTWTGREIEMGWDPEAIWSARLTISQCDPGDMCGHGRVVLLNWRSLYGRQRCRYSFRYERSEGSTAFFSTYVTKSRGPKACASSQMALSLMPSGMSLGIEEYWKGGWRAYGVLRRSATS